MIFKFCVFIFLFTSVLCDYPKIFEEVGTSTLERDSCSIDDLICNKKIENVLTDSNFSISDILVVTVASDYTDGLQRYLRSAKQYDITPEVLGLGKPWLGGDVTLYPGGGYKINLLRTYLEQYKNDNKILIFTDSYDVIFLSNLETILKQFLKMDARVLFSAEASCWPKKELSTKYPFIIKGKPYLNSGMFMGYVPDIYKMLTLDDIADTDDDQLYYTNAYLDENVRDQLKIKLDHLSEIFQNLYGAVAEVQITFDNNEPMLENTATKTVPLILHGNGFSKLVLNSLSNYLANNWNAERGCIGCWENTFSLDEVENKPIVLISIFIERPTPFLEEFFEKIINLNYPKDKIHLFIHNTQEYHAELVNEFIDKVNQDYLSIKLLSPSDNVDEGSARNMGLDKCLETKCDYYFNVDAEAHLDNRHTLKLLIEQNRTFVAPLLVRPGKAWSNFWGALSNGFYARSFDYMDIVHDNRRGLWNVPFINTCYLVNSTILQKYSRQEINYIKEGFDSDMIFCENLRNLNIFMYVSNRMDFGHLVNPENFDITRASPELYEIFDNRYDWEQRYIHENYTENFNPNKTALQPCPDVYWFPVTTMRFCKDLIHLVESFGQWSDGTNRDPRLDSGYEAVPTRDIHMNQVGWDSHWMLFLRDFVRPLQEMVFTGYYHDPPRSLMNFVVRYKPDEQPFLRPHHDSSTFTINLALNTADVDYEGGGCRFIRYNCSVTKTKPGWLLMHPGRLTHYHEGLLVTKGTRYIMISFVDP